MPLESDPSLRARNTRIKNNSSYLRILSAVVQRLMKKYENDEIVRHYLGNVNNPEGMQAYWLHAIDQAFTMHFEDNVNKNDPNIQVVIAGVILKDLEDKMQKDYLYQNLIEYENFKKPLE